MNKALIAVDIQSDITRNYKEIIDSTNSVIGRVVVHETPVVYMRHENLPQGIRTFKSNTHDSELAYDLEIVSDCIFTKYKGDVLTSEAFSDFVRKHGITDFYLTGVDACVCIKSACYNLLGDHYKVTILSDYITGYDKGKLDEMLQYYEKKGDITAILQELQKE